MSENNFDYMDEFSSSPIRLDQPDSPEPIRDEELREDHVPAEYRPEEGFN